MPVVRCSRPVSAVLNNIVQNNFANTISYRKMGTVANKQNIYVARASILNHGLEMPHSSSPAVRALGIVIGRPCILVPAEMSYFPS